VSGPRHYSVSASENFVVVENPVIGKNVIRSSIENLATSDKIGKNVIRSNAENLATGERVISEL
jgi:hypothetical protein